MTLLRQKAKANDTKNRRKEFGAWQSTNRQNGMIMLKGVNKQIIEITDTGNLYIQKAILFVDPEKREYDNDFLIHQGKKYIKDMSPDHNLPQTLKKQKTRKIIPTLIKLSAGIAIGATAASLLIR